MEYNWSQNDIRIDARMIPELIKNYSQLITEWSQNGYQNDHKMDQIMMLSLLRVYNGGKPTETLAILQSGWNTIDHRMISELTPEWFQN